MELKLKWPVFAPASYRLEQGQPRKMKPGDTKTLLDGDEHETWSVVRDAPKRGEHGPTIKEPMQIPGLYVRFAKYHDREGALGFVRTYGFLKDDKREPVDYILNWATAVRRLVKLYEKQKEKPVDRQDWKPLHEWVEANAHAVRIAPTLEAVDVGAPQLFFRPANLLSAIVLQFFRDMSTSALLRLCRRPGCGEYFYYGPGTTKREDAIFCSPRCQKSDAYQRSKEASQ